MTPKQVVAAAKSFSGVDLIDTTYPRPIGDRAAKRFVEASGVYTSGDLKLTMSFIFKNHHLKAVQLYPFMSILAPHALEDCRQLAKILIVKYADLPGDFHNGSMAWAVRASNFQVTYLTDGHKDCVAQYTEYMPNSAAF